MGKVPNLSISPETDFFIVSKARRSEGNVIQPDPTFDSEDDMADHGGKDSERSELFGFIRGLNVDEQIDLVALVWLGRGNGDLDNWRDLRAEATRAHNNRTASYLTGTPMLATIWRRRCRSSASALRISKSICDRFPSGKLCVGARP